MTTIRENVESLMAKYKKCRNDDKFLMMCYWKQIDGISVRDSDWPEQFFEKGTTPASIIRARALIQADGLYPSDAHIAAERAQRQEDMRNAIAKEGQVV